MVVEQNHTIPVEQTNVTHEVPTIMLMVHCTIINKSILSVYLKVSLMVLYTQEADTSAEGTRRPLFVFLEGLCKN